jgi:hypothetical protein
MDDERPPPDEPGLEPFPTWEFPAPGAPGERVTHETEPVPGEAPAEAAPPPAAEPPTEMFVIGSGTSPQADGVGPADDRPSGPRRGLGRWLVVGVAGLFVIVGAGIGIKLFALRGSGDVLAQMVPSDADVYVTAYLDPSLSQKLHLRTLVGKFPGLRGANGIDHRLDDLFAQAFQGSGLDFEKDVKPWLGTQIGLVVRVGDDQTHAVLLVSSKDDLAAQAALAKLRDGSSVSWKESDHDGVQISVGHGPTGEPLAYAYVDHTTILGDDEATVAHVIDADRGTTPTLTSRAEYTKALAGLSSDRLAFVYVNSGPLLDRFVGNFQASSGFDPTFLGGSSIDEVRAYRSVGATVSAESNGVAVRVSVNIDPTKLSAKSRKSLEGAAHRNVVLDWTPKDAYGLVAFTNVGDIVQQFVDQSSSLDPQSQRQIDQVGLTGPSGFVHHMTGDAGLVAGPGSAGHQVPNFALLLATDDQGSADRFLRHVRETVTDGIGSSDGRVQWREETYRVAPYGAVKITWLDAPDLGSMGLEPAYVAVKDMVIAGSSRDAVKDALDAHAGKGTIGDTSTFRDVLQGAEGDAAVVEYFDVQGIAQAVVDGLDPAARRDYENKVAPNLRPVKAFSFTGTNTTERLTLRLFVLIR